jgi:polyisoprenoid-binding protein YceI
MKNFLGTWIGVLLVIGNALNAQADAGGGYVRMDISLSPAGSFQARTTDVSGFAYYEGGKIKATPITVRMDQISTGIALRDRHLKERLETEKNPIAKITDLVSAEEGRGEGLLEYRSFKKRVPFAYKVDDTRTRATAKFKLKVSDFGLNDEIMYMGVGVEDEVELEVVVPVSKAAPPERKTLTGGH